MYPPFYRHDKLASEVNKTNCFKIFLVLYECWLFGLLGHFEKIFIGY